MDNLGSWNKNKKRIRSELSINFHIKFKLQLRNGLYYLSIPDIILNNLVWIILFVKDHIKLWSSNDNWVRIWT